jgi:multidrug efflux pump subunit AcrB
MSKTKKRFGLTEWALSNKTSVYVILFIISLMGILSYQSMPKESFPEIKQPTIFVNTLYPGNAPLDMENLVTRPIEKEINSLSGLKKLTSTSIQDFSIIVAEFDVDQNTTEVLQLVKDAVDRAKPFLPNDLPTEPDVKELDFGDFPVMNINVSGNYDQNRLKEFAEYLQDKIETLPEVSAADITGLTDLEVEISVDRIMMEALEISLGDIEQAISGENITMSGGEIKSISGEDISRRNLRIDGEFQDYQEIENVIIKNEFQNIVYLRDIATVSFGQKEPTSFARLNGNPVVTLDVKKKSGSNLLNAVEKINDIIENSQKNHFPKDLEIVVTNDQSKFTRSMVSNLENSIIMGIMLVVLVLVFFIGLRNSLFVGIAIPLSMFMGIAILNFTGNTLNMMVLFSLILALGMLVDNGIVVVENIYRLRTEGKSGQKAASLGVGEVALPIIASTATTVAAFVPLLFWKDLMGEFMKFLPITLIIVLSSSLFVALIINPVLTVKYMREKDKEEMSNKKYYTFISIFLVIGLLLAVFSPIKFMGGLIITGVIFSVVYRLAIFPLGKWFMSDIMSKIENVYEKTVSFALKGINPILFFVGSIFLMIGSIMFFGASNPKIVFFPDNEPSYVNIFIETPLGTDIETTDKITSNIEQKVRKVIEPHGEIIEAVLAQVGEKTSDPNEGPQGGSSAHKARITVSFIEYDKRVFISNVSTSEIMSEIREACKDIPEVQLTFSKDAVGPPVGKPINVEVIGEDFITLIEEVEKIKKKMEDANIAGVDQLKTDLELGKPEIEVKINREAARRFGVSTYQISSTLRTALQGKEITKLKQGKDDYEVNLRFNENFRYNLDNLMNTVITFRNMATGLISQVPISAVADIDFSSTYGSVKRRGMERVITIFSEVEEGYNANQIVGQFKELLKNYPIKDGYEFRFTGEQEEQAASTDFLVGAMLFAVLIIFLIIVSQFNSVLGPLVIMFSVLFSTTGVFLGFAIFKMPFSIMMSGIGIISLAGIVVNNAIVLIDYTNLLRQRKREELKITNENERLPKDSLLETIVQGGKTRLRPVLLTAITTVLGLIPLALGMNIDFYSLLTTLDPRFYIGGDNAVFWGPMAWTVIFGLVFATFMTLVIVPVMYWLVDKLGYWFSGLFNKS